MPEIEKTVQYAAQVNNLSEAWQFMMKFVDELNCTAPYIEISPVYGMDEDTIEFEVTVKATMEVEEVVVDA